MSGSEKATAAAASPVTDPAERGRLLFVNKDVAINAFGADVAVLCDDHHDAADVVKFLDELSGPDPLAALLAHDYVSIHVNPKVIVITAITGEKDVHYTLLANGPKSDAAAVMRAACAKLQETRK
jgi:hypothetical protein